MQDIIHHANTPYAPLIGSALLMRRAMRGDSLAPLAAALTRRLRKQPDDTHALLDYAIVLQLTGMPEIAMLMQERALNQQTLYSRPGGPLRLLVIMGPGELMWNTPIELLLEQTSISIDFLYLTHSHEWPNNVPDHDVTFVAMAESEHNRSLLLRLARSMPEWPRPVINQPQHIARLTRDMAATMLQDIAGLHSPQVMRVRRDALRQCDFFPFIARPVDSHAGRDLFLLRDAGDLNAYVERVGDDQFYVSPFIDYRSGDGLYRKYRVVVIMGQPFLSHLAISSHWLVHYLNAGMDESAAKRDEEAACMAQFDQSFGLRHSAALQQLYRRFGLEYLVIDCAELPNGELLIFEVGTAMAVHAMDDPVMYPYKQPAMARIFAAFQHMLERARMPI